MLNYKQLYHSNAFELPEPGSIELNPFPKHQLEQETDTARDEHIARLFQTNSHSFENYSSAYSCNFETLCAKENVYPFAVKAGPTKLCVLCKDCLMLCDWASNPQGKPHSGGDELVALLKW